MAAAGGGRWGSWATVLAGVVLLGCAVTWAAGSTPRPTDAGALPPTSGTGAAQLLVGPAAGSHRTSQARRSSAGDDRSRTAVSRTATAPLPRAAALSAGSPPVTVVLPSLSVTATVRPVHATDGVLQVPDDPAVVGWWAAGAALGSPAGTVVLDGHIDSATRGVGAFFRLAELAPGDPVVTATAAGTTVRWVVRARRVHAKTSALPAEVFRRDGPPQLVLISCGGAFDEQARSYVDNIVVSATPAG